MTFEKLISAVYRLSFLGAFVFLILAIAEKVVNLFGYTILRGAYSGGRILEFSAVLMIFVIALILRQVRVSVGK